MRIEFDPTNPDEAAAVRAMLTAMNGPEWSREIVKVNLVDGPNEAIPQYVPTGEVISSDTEERTAAITVQSVDSTGTPWDARIHSTPPTTNKDGTWRAKRGAKAEEIAAVKAERTATQDDPEELERVEAEVKETLATEPPLAPEAPKAPLAEPAESAPATPPAPPANEPSSTPTPAPTPPAPPANAGTSVPSFLDVMKAITAAQKDGKIDTAKVKELCAAVGAGESTMGLNGPDNGDKRGAFMALLDGECAA